MPLYLTNSVLDKSLSLEPQFLLGKPQPYRKFIMSRDEEYIGERRRVRARRVESLLKGEMKELYSVSLHLIIQSEA